MLMSTYTVSYNCNNNSYVVVEFGFAMNKSKLVDFPLWTIFK
jgi:hypothetical protein